MPDRVRKIAIPTQDPIEAAMILSKVLTSENLDLLVQLILGAPDLPTATTLAVES
jgi:hypothetical protein